MTTITQTGNLAAAPELKTSQKGRPWTEAHVLHTERLEGQDGTWSDGVTIRYNVKVFGAAARHLVETATASGKNFRVRFSGRQTVLDVTRKDGSTLRIYEVVADWIDPVLGQDLTLVKAGSTPPAQMDLSDPAWEAEARS